MQWMPEIETKLAEYRGRESLAQGGDLGWDVEEENYVHEISPGIPVLLAGSASSRKSSNCQFGVKKICVQGSGSEPEPGRVQPGAEPGLLVRAATDEDPCGKRGGSELT